MSDHPAGVLVTSVVVTFVSLGYVATRDSVINAILTSHPLEWASGKVIAHQVKKAGAVA